MVTPKPREAVFFITNLRLGFALNADGKRIGLTINYRELLQQMIAANLLQFDF